MDRFLTLAKSLETRDAMVGYLLRQYALQLGIELLDANPALKGDAAMNATIERLFGELEAAKGTLALGSQEEQRNHLAAFATSVFSRSDELERQGTGDKVTAQGFLTAVTLYEATKQFGPLDPDIAEKVKYAKFKAASILKCLKEGVPYVPVRTEVEEPPPAPSPPPPPPAAAAAAAAVPSPPPPAPPAPAPPPPPVFAPPPAPPPAVYHPPPQPFPTPSAAPPPAYAPPRAPPAPAPAAAEWPPRQAAVGMERTPRGYAPDLQQQTEALRSAKQGVSALLYGDVTAGYAAIRRALEALDGAAGPR